MIGNAAIISGAGSVVVVAVLLGAGGPDPGTTRRAEQLLQDRSRDALAAIGSLEEALMPALDAARDGASLVVQGEEPPGRRLGEAADVLEAAADEAERARDAVAALDGARRAADPRAAGLPAVIGAGELAAIANDLRAAGPGANAVAELRRGASRLLDAIERALAAAAARRLDDARREVEAARAEHEVLLASRAVSSALPVWLDTTDAMITLVTRRIDAMEAGDEEAAAAAAAEFGAMADEAVLADRALGIAIGEAADGATRLGVPRLGAALASVQQVRDAVLSATPQP